VAAQAVLGDRYCMAIRARWWCMAGHGRGGGHRDHTEIGRISTLLEEVHSLTTPLLRQMQVFGRWLTVAIMALAVLTFVFGWLVHQFHVATCSLLQ